MPDEEPVGRRRAQRQAPQPAQAPEEERPVPGGLSPAAVWNNPRGAPDPLVDEEEAGEELARERKPREREREEDPDEG